jgi:hypothetical protein
VERSATAAPAGLLISQITMAVVQDIPKTLRPISATTNPSRLVITTKRIVLRPLLPGSMFRRTLWRIDDEALAGARQTLIARLIH